MTRASNRQSMPIIAEFVDSIRKSFHNARVTYASENGIEQGKRGPVGVIPIVEKRIEHLAVAKSKRQTKLKGAI